MKKILILLSALLVVLTACEKQTGERQDEEREEEQRPAPKISINPDKLVFSPAGGTQKVTVTSNYHYSMIGNGNISAWYSLEDNNNRIIITCRPSDGTEERSDKLICRCYGYNDDIAEAELTIIQTEHSISLDKAELNMDVTGGTEEITVTSTDDWVISGCPNWCSTSARSGSSGDKISLYFSYNSSKADRSSAVVFSCGNKSVECTVSQSADDSPIIDFKDPLFLNGILDYKSFYDKNRDGEISEREASLITELEICSGVRNMDEIKYFTALTWLDCQGNQLTTLDVSNNTALTDLMCTNNQLTTLNVSNNTALTDLGCTNNQLTTLDLSNNTALTWLDCNNNQLTTLDLSNNTALRSLECQNNQLTTLDVSNNTALRSLECQNNQLTTLDVSNNTALTHLYCQNNQLTTLDLSRNKRLTILHLADYNSINTTITELILYKYQIIDNLDEQTRRCPNLTITYVE